CSPALLKPFSQALLDRTFELRLAELPAEVVFARKDAPRPLFWHIMPPELQEQQIGHHGDGYRAFTALRRVGDLMLPEARASLQFFAEDRHGPPPAIDSNHLAGGHSGAIGHQDLRRVRPSVTPFLTQHDEDSSTRPETRPVGIGPRGSTATG